MRLVLLHHLRDEPAIPLDPLARGHDLCPGGETAKERLGTTARLGDDRDVLRVANEVDIGEELIGPAEHLLVAGLLALVLSMPHLRPIDGAVTFELRARACAKLVVEVEADAAHREAERLSDRKVAGDEIVFVTVTPLSALGAQREGEPSGVDIRDGDKVTGETAARQLSGTESAFRPVLRVTPGAPARLTERLIELVNERLARRVETCFTDLLLPGAQALWIGCAEAAASRLTLVDPPVARSLLTGMLNQRAISSS